MLETLFRQLQFTFVEGSITEDEALDLDEEKLVDLFKEAALDLDEEKLVDLFKEAALDLDEEQLVDLFKEAVDVSVECFFRRSEERSEERRFPLLRDLPSPGVGLDPELDL
eukprot:CAMPEP_0170896474 /NCGR_PEP_ID=MMETSP0734-20130129/44808_1 /TAXON_ID=186038 /ORGANISM="Fragilariopsis kerguelensis, Strain L26-C5" /LENGTH=110 /DNA_ID=CAMNT_0011288707 /DNA_START=2176 /DNA_END=2508 /DNA_ORIENTATION=+